MLDKDRIPQHVAIIMDGNGRWAKAHSVPRVAGHNAGMKAMKKIVDHSDKLGVKYLTVYAFSTENWKRSMEEVGGIFKLLVKYVQSDLKGLIENNVHVNILGDYTAIPEDARKSLDKTLEKTKANDGLVFNIALNYGSRDEIKRGIQKLCEQIKNGELEPEDIDEEMISGSLYTGQYNVPDPEVVIRTSGEERLSNFLMWQSAYSELVFVDDLWPDFTPEKYDEALEVYQSRDRRFGGR